VTEFLQSIGFTGPAISVLIALTSVIAWSAKQYVAQNKSILDDIKDGSESTLKVLQLQIDHLKDVDKQQQKKITDAHKQFMDSMSSYESKISKASDRLREGLVTKTEFLKELSEIRHNFVVDITRVEKDLLIHTSSSSRTTPNLNELDSVTTDLITQNKRLMKLEDQLIRSIKDKDDSVGRLEEMESDFKKREIKVKELLSAIVKDNKLSKNEIMNNVKEVLSTHTNSINVGLNSMKKDISDISINVDKNKNNIDSIKSETNKIKDHQDSVRNSLSLITSKIVNRSSGNNDGKVIFKK